MPSPAPLRFIDPARPQPVATPPTGDGWFHEVKFDGYRTQLVIEPRNARAFSMSGLNWSDRYRPTLEDAARLDCRSAIIDGEMILPDERGASDFHGLAGAIARTPERLVLVAFDLLHLNGKDLRHEPAEQRRSLLRAMIGSSAVKQIAFSEALEVPGPEAFQAVDKMGLEGIVSKRRGARYQSGATRSWVKTKAYTEGRFQLVGLQQPEEGPAVALLASAEDPTQYAGSAFVTLPSEARERFWRYVERNQESRAPVRGIKPKQALWVRPGLMVRAKHLRGEETLRHATLTGVES